MHSKGRFPNMMFGASLRPESAVVAIMLVLLFLLFVFLFLTLTAQPAEGQTYQVIYNFTGGLDGGGPAAGLTMDRARNLYGVTSSVFKLSNQGSGWLFTVLYHFTGWEDGGGCQSRLTIGPDGVLYGTTAVGGGNGCYAGEGCGTVFNVRPAAHISPSTLSGWTKSVLYRFTGGNDGNDPQGDLVFDQAGNLYGTTLFSYDGCCNGSVYQLTPSGGGWQANVLYDFPAGFGYSGSLPAGGVVFDQAGNLYGVTSRGGDLSCSAPYGCGVIYQMTPSGGGWIENVLYQFHGGSDGGAPVGSLSLDRDGNLYGITEGYGPGPSTVFMLSHGSWQFSVLYNSCGFCGPGGSLSMDAEGNLYGMMYGGGIYRSGGVFKLTRSGSGWTYTDLHDFGSDGKFPVGDLLIDPRGNVYGSAQSGGSHNQGVVWEITP